MRDPLTQHLAAAQPLSELQVRAVVEALVDENVSATKKAEFLSALARKGETVEEIAAFTTALRERAVVPPLEAAWRESREILDVCGTGGDHLSTFNISTTVALVCAAAGVAVAKHGNRAITSQAGSADVLETLGVQIDLSPAEAARSLNERNFAFFFAPNFHPAFRHIAPARKLCAERKQRTIFNYLGPLLNPARPTAQLVGVPQPNLCRPIAHALQSLGIRRAMVVCGGIAPDRGDPPLAFDLTNRVQNVHLLDVDGESLGIQPVSSLAHWANREQATILSLVPNAHPPICKLVQLRMDELSTLGENTIAEFYQERGFATSTLDPRQFPLQPATLADLRGGDKHANAEIIRRILRGDDRGPKLDAVLLNAGAALFVAGRARSLAEGWDVAAKVIEDGRAFAKLQELTVH